MSDKRPDRGRRPPGARSAAGAGAALAACIAAVYAGSFSGAYVFDDPPSIAENPTIRRLWPLSRVFSPPATAGVGGRPLLNLSFALNYAVSGTGIWSYHAANLAIHLCAALALFGIVRRTLEALNPPRVGEGGSPFNSTLLACFIALLWALHPLQTASVTYLSQRAESLMGLFYLLTLYCFIRGAEAGVGAGARVGAVAGVGDPGRPASARPATADAGSRPRRDRRPCFWFGLSWLSCLCGVLTKEVAVTAPAIVFLYDRTFVSGTFREAWRRRAGYHLGLAASWAPLGFLMAGLHGRGVGFGFGVGPLTYALTESGVMLRYLRLAAWPHPLILDYDLGIVTRLGAAWPCVLAVGLLAVAAGYALVRGRGAWRGIGFLGAGFFILLAPTSSLVPVPSQPMAENRMYLPLAAAVALGAIFVHAVAGRRAWPLFLLVAAGWGGLTMKRNAEYGSEVRLWQDTVAARPNNVRALCNLAAALTRAGRPKDALNFYERALRVNPGFVEIHSGVGDAEFDLGNGMVAAGRAPEAITHFEAALRANPDFPEAEANLANVFFGLGRLPEAIRHYQNAIALRPDYADAHFNLAGALAASGRLLAAASEYEAVLRLRPDDGQARRNLAKLEAAEQVPGPLN